MAESKELTVSPPGGAVASIVPQTLTEVNMLADMIAAAKWAPKSYLVDPKNEASGPDKAKIAIGIMQGLEVGLKPIQALQSIAVVNGIPSLYGDGALAVLYASNVVEDFREEEIRGDWQQEKNTVVAYRCTLKRKGRPTPTVREFSLEQAAKANLLGKTGPWQQYRARMLQMRARAWTMRDAAADVLKGMAIFEEVLDIEAAVVPPTDRPAAPRSAGGKLDAFAKPEPEPVSEAEFEDVQKHPEASRDDSLHIETPPSEVQEQFAIGKFSPWVNWFAETVERYPAENRQQFADAYADALLKVAAHSDRNKAVVGNIAATKGFELPQPKEVSEDGQASQNAT